MADKRGPKRLSLKEKGFCRDFVLGEEPGNATEAASLNYNCKNRAVAAYLGHNRLQNPRIQAEIERILEIHNINRDFLAESLRDGLRATVVSTFEGETVQSEIPDLNIRHKYFQDAAKILQMYPPERSESVSVNLDMQVESMSRGEMKKMLKELLSQMDEGNNNEAKSTVAIGSGKEGSTR